MEKPTEKNHSLKNQRGQVALFVALIFQVLFIFFAMIVNVGLLVHHKINLQNSVDLAAYYGAMKQAEMLNAIAHVNYQIRQSFKLLNFRYHQLGTAGLASSPSRVHPFRAGDVNGISQILNEDDVPFPRGTAFCMAYEPWDIIQNTESYCKNLRDLPVPRLGVPGATSHPFTIIDRNLIAYAEASNDRAQRFCRFAMSVNWLQLAKFIAAYKYDIRNRKKLLLSLANEISKPEPRDIQGESIRDGVFRTLYRNLSGPNKESLGASPTGATNPNDAEFKFINSFANGSCRGNPSEVTPPGWLSEVLIFPIYSVFEGDCAATGTAGRFYADGFNWNINPNVPPGVRVSPNIPLDLQNFANELAQLAQDASTNDPQRLLFRSSLGFEKNPWCVGYVGVSATTTPKIPFTPLGAVTMKARAFAKPFGGRIGPWYGKTWPTNTAASESNGAAKADRTDQTVPFRVGPTVNLPSLSLQDYRSPQNTENIEINHSRYLGDRVGIFSQLTMAHFAQAIHRMGGNNNKIVTGWWNHIFTQDFDQKNVQGDPLAWHIQTNSAPPMRDLEIAAVAPDQFDAATYSIDPDFYNNYLVKMQRVYGQEFNFALRGDLGSRMQDNNLQRFSIRNQIAIFQGNSSSKVDAQSKLTYYLNKFGQVLTSWQQRTPDSYVLDDSRFGRCLDQGSDQIAQDGDPKFHTIGSCKAGGRVGYSVKLVDGQYLNNRPGGYSLGGAGTSGNILNPPPANF